MNQKQNNYIMVQITFEKLHKLFLLKHWPASKIKFEKTYGINNTVLSANDILNFMNLYIRSNGEIENTEL